MSGSFGGFDLFLPIAAFGGADMLGAIALGDFFGHERRLAHRTGLINRLVPQRLLALGILGAGIKNLAAP